MTLESGGGVCMPKARYRELLKRAAGDHQVEATTEKQAVLIRGNGLFSRVVKCTGIMARPVLLL